MSYFLWFYTTQGHLAITDGKNLGLLSCTQMKNLARRHSIKRAVNCRCRDEAGLILVQRALESTPRQGRDEARVRGTLLQQVVRYVHRIL